MLRKFRQNTCLCKHISPRLSIILPTIINYLRVHELTLQPLSSKINALVIGNPPSPPPTPGKHGAYVRDGWGFTCQTSPVGGGVRPVLSFCIQVYMMSQGHIGISGTSGLEFVTIYGWGSHVVIWKMAGNTEHGTGKCYFPHLYPLEQGD